MFKLEVHLQLTSSADQFFVAVPSSPSTCKFGGRTFFVSIACPPPTCNRTRPLFCSNYNSTIYTQLEGTNYLALVASPPSPHANGCISFFPSCQSILEMQLALISFFVLLPSQPTIRN